MPGELQSGAHEQKQSEHDHTTSAKALDQYAEILESHFPRAVPESIFIESASKVTFSFRQTSFVEKAPRRGRRRLPFVYEIHQCGLPPRVKKAPRPEPCSTS